MRVTARVFHFSPRAAVARAVPASAHFPVDGHYVSWVATQCQHRPRRGPSVEGEAAQGVTVATEGQQPHSSQAGLRAALCVCEACSILVCFPIMVL